MINLHFKPSGGFVKRFIALICSLCFSSSFIQADPRPDLPPPYNTIDVLPFDSHGFYANAAPMEHLLRTKKVKTVIEVGAWLGSSTRHIASVIPEDGKVYAIDHWQGSIEHQEGNNAYYKALPYLYQQFLSNVIHAGLTNKIIPLQMSSLEAAQHLSETLDERPDMVYLDASHDYRSVYEDLCAWYPFVQNYGILCGDDWSWVSVRKAVKQFAKERNLRLKSHGNFWYILP